KDYNLTTMTEWEAKVIDFISIYLKDKKCSLVELQPQKGSILYEFEDYTETKINGKKVIYVNDINLPVDKVKVLVKEADFYLGHIIIIIGNIETEVDNIISNWDSLFKSGLEIINLTDDGRTFYLINPLQQVSH